MSLTFSQTLSLIDRNCKSNTASYPLADKTADINIAMDIVTAEIITSAGKWQYDDSNNTDYPEMRTNLTAGQRDYPFTTDESGNLILDIYKVMVKDESGVFHEIYPVDKQSDEEMQSFFDGREQQGLPRRYDKTGNSIFLDCVPSYSSSLGLKVYYNRESSYFQTTDTTKKAGFAGLFHEFLALYPSMLYTKRNKMFDLSDRYQKDVDAMLLKIKQYYRDRGRDESPVITPETVNSV